jgi:ketosteroid isomerase-like protein
MQRVSRCAEPSKYVLFPRRFERKMEGMIMRNLTNIRGMKRLVVVVMATACLWGTNSYAEPDEAAVKAAVAAYNAAVDSPDAAKMEAIWAHDDTVMDIEPGTKTIAVGWDAVRKNIEGFFPAFVEVKNVQADGPHVQITGDVARSMGIAMVSYKLKDRTTAKDVGIFQTDVFEKRGGVWLVVSHSVALTGK